MIDILQNELVKKYFGCDCGRDGEPSLHNHFVKETCEDKLSVNVLKSMQEPIRDGERCLILDGNGWKEWKMSGDGISSTYHPDSLRLPDKFQTAVKMHNCPECGVTHVYLPAQGTQPAPENAYCEVEKSAPCPHYKYLNCGHKPADSGKCNCDQGCAGYCPFHGTPKRAGECKCITSMCPAHGDKPLICGEPLPGSEKAVEEQVNRIKAIYAELAIPTFNAGGLAYNGFKFEEFLRELVRLARVR